jgi:hypothetical protein
MDPAPPQAVYPPHVMAGVAHPQTAAVLQAAPEIVRPPAARARRIAVVLSIVAVVFSLAFGVSIRRAYALRESNVEDAIHFAIAAMVFLLVALLLRMGAAIGELLWLERTWSNLPERLRKVGPVENVSSGLAIGISFVPGIAWIWKLGLVTGIVNGFETVRTTIPFTAPMPRRLGMAAVIVGWVPGLSVYVAPFLWEMFARRIDVVVQQIVALSERDATSDSRT